MITASPSPSPSPYAKYLTETEQLGQLPTPPTSEPARQQAKQTENTRQFVQLQENQPSRSYLAPNESFVILQDSVIQNIPSAQPTAPTKGATENSPRNVVMNNAALATALPSPEVEQPNPSPISHHLRSTTRLFNLLSSRTDIDHPLCAECTQILLSSLQRQLDETKKERDGYIAFEKEVRKEKERESQDMSRDEIERKIERLKAEERIALDQLKAAEREKEQLEEELRALELEEKALQEEEAE